MKKAVNINFIMVLVLVVALGLTALGLGVDLHQADKMLDETGGRLNSYIECGEVSDVEGYGYLFEGTFYGIARVAEVFGWIVVYFLAVYAALLLVPALIARLIYKGSGARLLLYRIFMFLVYALIALFAFLLGAIIVEGKLSFSYFALTIVFVYAVAVTILGIRNTYTSRIRCEGGEINELEIEEVQ